MVAPPATLSEQYWQARARALESALAAAWELIGLLAQEIPPSLVAEIVARFESRALIILGDQTSGPPAHSDIRSELESLWGSLPGPRAIE
jgi:hypothetical protein